MTEAYLALGSNIDNPIQHVTSAIAELRTLPKSMFLKASKLYQNPPIGFLEQPDFINAVVKIQTTLLAEELLDQLFEIEQVHRRSRNIKNGPRTLDLDLLLYGNTISNTDKLVIPHPRLKERAFVVYPLYELSPDLVLPCGTQIKDLVASMCGERLQGIKDE